MSSASGSELSGCGSKLCLAELAAALMTAMKLLRGACLELLIEVARGDTISMELEAASLSSILPGGP